MEKMGIKKDSGLTDEEMEGMEEEESGVGGWKDAMKDVGR